MLAAFGCEQGGGGGAVWATELVTGATLTQAQYQRLTVAHRPARAFTEMRPPASPNYASAESWAALWPRTDEADVAPPNSVYPEAQGAAGIDVFFVHPTCYAKPDSWNGPIDDPDVRHSVSGIMMYLASVYNAGARVYAPRYRQFGLYAVLEKQTISGLLAIDLAYSDVRRAFDHYINHYNQGRPFILAGHSQGSIHGSRLLQEKIMGTPLQSRLVAAYLIGMTIPSSLPGIQPSTSPTDLGKVINWNSFTTEGSTTFLTEDVPIWVGDAYRKAKGVASVQVNPRSWRLNGGKVAALDNPGTLPASASSTLPACVPGVTSADASGKVLIVDKPAIPGFAGDGPSMPLLNADLGDFHNYDYQLFYESIRKNVLDRARAFLTKQRGSPHGH
ncbi:MAG: DUF3089 domain-containing protein [Candidatus Riflebacteria bacterium]|nr:DUF3089 domain-containing protein [Candidatus Riflebacteria bacterium]